jgi:transcriptional regulator with XRE-family HTH domain
MDVMSQSTLNERVAEEIRVQLARRNITATELARRAGMTQRSISRRITGEKAIDMDDLEKIAKALDVPITALLPTPTAARKPSASSVQLHRTQPMLIRTAETAPGHTTPTLANPPSMTPIVRPTEHPATTTRNSRPVRLSSPSADGGAR